VSDPWDLFGGMVDEEAETLQRLNDAALALTRVLVSGSPEAIANADRDLNQARIAHQHASAKRRSMQVRGFGSMPLQQVCAYAPRPVAIRLSQKIAELRYGAISLRLTIENNKSLIVAGLDRLIGITSRLQESASERTGVYKRRGYVAPPGASVIVSSKV
jgi:hypothetical protein